MKKIVSLFLSTWDSLSEEQKDAALRQVSPNAVLKEAVMTWSDARRMRQMDEADFPDELLTESDEEDVIEAEFVEMKETFGSD